MDRWIFLITVKNRPGALAAITALFAERGVSLDSVVAHDSGQTQDSFGVVTLTFRAGAARKENLARLLARLAIVQGVREYRYDDEEHARKSAFARVALSADDLVRALPPGVLCDIVSVTEDETLALLLGPPVLLDTALSELADRGLLRAMGATVLVVP